MTMPAEPVVVSNVEHLELESQPRWYRRIFIRYTRRFLKGFAAGLFVFMAAMYAWRFYLEAWPLLLPLLATNPAFFYVTVVVIALGAVAVFLSSMYTIFI